MVSVWLTRSTAVLRITSWFDDGGTGSLFFCAYASSVPSTTSRNDSINMRLDKRIKPPYNAYR
jgi:hypothetical protein